MKTNFAKFAARRSPAYLKQRISKLMLHYVFEPNDNTTRATIKRQLANLFDELEVADYCIVCDATNNTPKVIDAGTLVVDVAIKFDKDDPFVHHQVKLLGCA